MSCLFFPEHKGNLYIYHSLLHIFLFLRGEGHYRLLNSHRRIKIHRIAQIPVKINLSILFSSLYFCIGEQNEKKKKKISHQLTHWSFYDWDLNQFDDKNFKRFEILKIFASYDGTRGNRDSVIFCFFDFNGIFFANKEKNTYREKRGQRIKKKK